MNLLKIISRTGTLGAISVTLLSMMLACAGGSSGNGNNAGSTGSTAFPPSTPSNPEALQAGGSGNFDKDVAESFLSDEEFLDMNSSNRGDAISPNERIKAHVAYGYGLSGEGTRIAIMDEGALLKSHVEFSGKNILTLDNGQLSDHSNAVTGLAAASRNNRGMMGIAHGADLLTTTFDDLPNAKFEDKVNWITENNGDVWSNSWGVEVPTENDQIGEVVNFRNTQGLTSGQALAESLDAPGTQARWDAIAAAMDKFQANGGVVVWANDNTRTFSDAGVMPGLAELYPELREAWIVVVNTTAVSTLRNAGKSSSGLKTEGGYALLSAPCGRTAPYCLSMDGFQVRSAVSTGNQAYGIFSGTSMAAPMVAGAMALLREAFPNHTPEELTIRALASADNSWFTADGFKNWGNGVQHAYSNEFGHGFIDLERALRPLGTVTATSASSESFVLSDGASEIQMSPAFGESVQNSLSEKQFIMQDGLDGRFMINLGNFVSMVNPEDVQETQNGWQRQRNRQLVQVPLVSGLVMQFDQQFQPNSLINQRDGSSIELQTALSNGSTLLASYGGSINTALGFQTNSGMNTGLDQTEPFEIPFTGFAFSSVWGAWQTGNPGNSWTLGWFGNEDDEYASTGALADKTWAFGNIAALQFTGGTVTEKGGLLGSRTSGAFANDLSTTAFARAAVNVHLVHNWKIRGNYMIGHSWAEADKDTLFTDFSNLATDSFAVSLTGQDVLTGKDQIQLTLFQPLRALSGTTTVTLPTSQNASNNYALLYTSESIDLTPKGRELRLIGSYSKEPWEGALIDLTATLTHQRLHNPDAGIAAGVFSGLKFAF
ncbi:MAG: S8 family serine peptidase [Nitrospirota bacterium]|nr:MAG: S8 family serine peptidase [Nitrospirota bacterium]